MLIQLLSTTVIPEAYTGFRLHLVPLMLATLSGEGRSHR